MKRHVSKLIWIALAALAAVFLIRAFMPKPVEADMARVWRGFMQVTIDEDGQTRIRDRYQVTAPLRGQLTRTALNEGDRIEAGKTVLASILPAHPELLDERSKQQAAAHVLSAEMAVAAAQANVSAVQTRLDLAAATARRLAPLAESGSASKQEYDEAFHAHNALQHELEAAQFTVRIRNYELETATAALLMFSSDQSAPSAGPFQIFAPIDGTILRVHRESAGIVVPGDALLEVGDPQNLEIAIDVLSQDAVKIRPGNRVQLHRWGGEEVIAARVRMVEPAAFTKVSALGVDEQRVWIVADFVDPRDKWALLGDHYRVEASIVIWEEDNALMIPSGSLFRRQDQWAVFRVDNGKASLAPVRIGRQNGLEAQVLEGVNENDAVLVHPSDKVAHGVSVIERNSSNDTEH